MQNMYLPKNSFCEGIQGFELRNRFRDFKKFTSKAIVDAIEAGFYGCCQKATSLRDIYRENFSVV